MKTIAITGGIGAGKSTAAEIIREKGYIVIDTDALSRDVTEKGSPLLEYLVREFGEDITDPDGCMDRKKVARIAFSDDRACRRIEQLIQTAIKIRMKEKLYELRLKGAEKLVFVEVPLLFEAGWQREFDGSLLICAAEDVRIERVMKRSSMTRAEVIARINKQMSQEEKIKLSDYVIANDGNYEELYDKLTVFLTETEGELL